MSQSQKNMAIWDEKSKSYPFHREIDKRNSPDPAKTPFSFRGDFLAVPIPEYQVVFWGFMNEEDARQFERDYGGRSSVGTGQ